MEPENYFPDKQIYTVILVGCIHLKIQCLQNQTCYYRHKTSNMWNWLFIQLSVSYNDYVSTHYHNSFIHIIHIIIIQKCFLYTITVLVVFKTCMHFMWHSPLWLLISSCSSHHIDISVLIDTTWIYLVLVCVSNVIIICCGLNHTGMPYLLKIFVSLWNSRLVTKVMQKWLLWWKGCV